MPKRILPKPWIESYLRYLKDWTEAPEIFNTWSAISVIAASMKRNTWLNRGGWNLYPNTYVVLVANPGFGKGAALNPAVDILKEAGSCNILSGRLTIEYVLERLAKGFGVVNIGTAPAIVGSAASPVQTVTFGTDHSAFIFQTELSVFLRNEDALVDLADLWDSRTLAFEYKTRHSGQFTIPASCQSMLGGSSQMWLAKSIPPNAVGGGFTRRTNFVLSRIAGPKISWPQNSHPNHNNLVEDLRAIAQLSGEFKFASQVRPAFEKIYGDSVSKDFDDEAVSNFKTSRWIHTTKAAMALCASRSDSLEISKADWEQAVALVDQVIEDIPIVFRSVGEGEMAGAADKVLRFLELRGYASQKELIRIFCPRHLSSEDLARILTTLRDGGVVDERQVGSGKIMYSVNSGYAAAAAASVATP